MSGTESLNSFQLEYEHLNTKSSQKCRVTVTFEGEPIHIDSFDVSNQRSRSSFLKKASEKAENTGAKFDADELEGQLVKLSYDLSLGILADEDDDANVDDFDAERILEDLGIDLLGEGEDQSILLWSQKTNKRYQVNSASRWGECEILQVVGPDAAGKLWCEDPGKRPEGTYSPSEVRKALALAASQAPRIQANNLLGQGVWRLNNGLLIVDGAVARRYDGNEFKRLRRPRSGKKIIDFNAEKEWHGDIPNLVRGMTVKQSRKYLQQLRRLLRNWNWTHLWDAGVLAALVFSTFIQSCWTWRPLVSIIGTSDSGKSTLLSGLLLPVMLDWAIAADRSTEAGLRQAIGHDSMPVAIDEFDKYRQRQQVMELFRTASRGGKVLRGTADQSGQSFGVKHLAWFAAIESGDIWNQDRNRFIRVELQPPTERGNLVLPGVSKLNKLGRNIAAAAIWAAPVAVPLADAIKSTRIDGVHGRLVESYSIPASMFAVLWDGREATEQQATK